MIEKSQDALCYVRKFGSPHLFITMTCNPKWDDIKCNIHPGQQASDRYDVVSRVFFLKVKQFKKILVKQELFGQVQCYLYTIEWQKRGIFCLLLYTVLLYSHTIDNSSECRFSSVQCL